MLAVAMATAGCQRMAGAPRSAESAGATIRFVASLIHIAGTDAELCTHVDVGPVTFHLIAGPENMKAVACITLHLVARQLVGVRPRDDLDPMPATTFPRLRAVAQEGIAAGPRVSCMPAPAPGRTMA
jgi:hypothetical protein